ncbi:MAG: TIGR00341 family protein, partial [Anaerolineae bacterium]|nr:TIGR00341 family protein [Anaerolineae bacterium]
DVVTGILNRCDETDLVVLGFSEESSLDNWLFGDIPQRMLSRTPGPLILVKQNMSAQVTRQVRQTLANVMPTLTPSEEHELVQAALEMSRPTVDFIALVVLSCLIATLGLMQNSAAVIIGAMLIAPLMSPLVGFAVGLIRGDWRLMRESALTLVRGVGLTLLLAVAVGLFSPIKNPTSEMLARGQPSLPDLGVALASGMAGAYATARKDIPAALAGVAIAAALMPPVCTVGIALAFGLPELASGAFFLFVMNIIAITVGAAIIFLWLGVRLRSGVDDPGSYRQRLVISVLVLLVLAVPLTESLRTSALAARELESVWSVLERDLEGDVVDVAWKGGTRGTVVATVRAITAPTPEEVALLQQRMTESMGMEVTLELVVMQLVLPAAP